MLGDSEILSTHLPSPENSFLVVVPQNQIIPEVEPEKPEGFRFLWHYLIDSNSICLKKTNWLYDFDNWVE